MKLVEKKQDIGFGDYVKVKDGAVGHYDDVSAGEYGVVTEIEGYSDVKVNTASDYDRFSKDDLIVIRSLKGELTTKTATTVQIEFSVDELENIVAALGGTLYGSGGDSEYDALSAILEGVA